MVYSFSSLYLLSQPSPVEGTVYQLNYLLAFSLSLKFHCSFFHTSEEETGDKCVKKSHFGTVGTPVETVFSKHCDERIR